MAPGAPAFDPNRYKATTREQWQTAAEAWHRWGPTLHAWLGDATNLMLDMMEIREGLRVLDVAARRVGASGRIVATDISSNILEFARRAAQDAGVRNVETRVMDGEKLELSDASFDAVISRVGLIYLPDRHKALVGMHRVLRAGGRVGAITYSTSETNAFFSVPVSIIRRRADVPPPVPGQPGPFSLGKPGALEEAFAEAGFQDIRARVVPAPLRLSSAAECVRFERESFGALHQMLSGVAEGERPSVWSEIESDLKAFQGSDGFVGPCELVVAVGVK